jgi:hypothetical protein
MEKLPTLNGREGTVHRFLIKRPKRGADALLDALVDFVKMEEAMINFHNDGFLITTRFLDRRDEEDALDYMRKCLAGRFGDVSLYHEKRSRRG